ncbi:hypothetical protein F4810DRAFT_679529 [Camillea tinctor]|nr:hypothetical protein F4810DRAFT_679529 [Camillea tinctor]
MFLLLGLASFNSLFGGFLLNYYLRCFCSGIVGKMKKVVKRQSEKPRPKLRRSPSSLSPPGRVRERQSRTEGHVGAYLLVPCHVHCNVGIERVRPDAFLLPT